VQASVTATLDATARILAVVNCDGQPATCVPTQSQVLQAALSGAGLSYEIVGDANTFLQRIRENRHNVRILYRSSSSATNSYWELRELTFEGGGLVVVNDASPDSDPKLREPMGITTSGRINTVGAVSITGGDLGPNRTITVAGSGVSQTPQAATAKVVGTTSKGAVATTNRYGSGRAVTLTFNPELNNTAAMRALLVDTVRFAAGGALVPGVPGAPQYVKLQSALATPAGPLDFRLDAWTATGLLPLSDAGAPMTPPRTWTFPLVAGTPAARTLGVSAGQPGTYAVLGELTLTTGQPPRLIASGTVDVTITGSIADLKASAIAATQAVPAGLNDTAKAAALSALQAVDPAPATRAACSASITKALEATDKLKTISGTQAMEARLKTDQLLRALQVLYPTLP